MVEKQSKITDTAMKSLANLQRAGFDDDKAKALVEMTVGLINETASPTLKQFESLRTDVRHVDKNLGGKIQRIEKKSDDMVKGNKMRIKIMIFGFAITIVGMIGVIVSIFLVM